MHTASIRAAIRETMIPVLQLTAPLSMPPIIPMMVRRQTTLTEVRTMVSAFDEESASMIVSSRQSIRSMSASTRLYMARAPESEDTLVLTEAFFSTGLAATRFAGMKFPDEE